MTNLASGFLLYLKTEVEGALSRLIPILTFIEQAAAAANRNECF